jgi:hypothetical protein
MYIVSMQAAFVRPTARVVLSNIVDFIKWRSVALDETGILKICICIILRRSNNESING